MSTPYQQHWLGKTLDGKYHIEAVLGEGGFGIVYRARQLSTRRRVAVKMMRPSLLLEDDPLVRTALVERFRRELHLVAELDHPHVVSILDAGGAAYPNAPAPLYAVFVYIEGQTLGEVLREEGCLSVYETRRLLFQAAEALAVAHLRGITHRDVKPDNLMVSGHVPEHRNVHVLDFGIAGVKREAEAQHLPDDSAGITRTGDLLGTPAYMAPEQINDLRNTTPAADLYAWALVYLECLTGQRVVQTRDAFAAYAFHTGEDPVPIPPQVRNLADASWLAWCLQKDPLMRPQDAAELLAFIGDALRRETPEHLGSLQRRKIGEERRRGTAALLRGLRWCGRACVLVGVAFARAWRTLVRSVARDFKTLLVLIFATSLLSYIWLWKHAPTTGEDALVAIGTQEAAAHPVGADEGREDRHPASAREEGPLLPLRRACVRDTSLRGRAACVCLWAAWWMYDRSAARAWFARCAACAWTPPPEFDRAVEFPPHRP